MTTLEQLSKASDAIGEKYEGSLRNLCLVSVCEIARIFKVSIEDAASRFHAFDNEITSASSMGEDLYFHSPSENPFTIWYFSNHGSMEGYEASEERQMESNVTKTMSELSLWVD